MQAPSTMRMRFSALALLLTGASAHSWVEQLMNIAPNGTMVGDPGYQRGFIPRGDGFSDDVMVNRILVSTLDPQVVQQTLKDTPMCKDGQQQPQPSSSKFPPLKSSPGSTIALRYLENGHVTKPDTPPNKPSGSGTVLVYGTYSPKPDEKLLDVWNSWTTDGSGGDKRGFLLSNTTFDDQQCYEANGTPVSAKRQQQFPKKNDQLQGANLWCQVDLMIPTDAKPNQSMALYWVWDWHTEPAGTVPGEIETYTACADVDIVANANTNNKEVKSGFVKGQDWNNAAAISQFPHLKAQSPSTGSDGGSDGTSSNATTNGSSAGLASSAIPAAPSTQTVAAMSAVSSSAGGAANSGFQTVTVTGKSSYSSTVPLPEPTPTPLSHSSGPATELSPPLLATESSVSTVMVTVTSTNGAAGTPTNTRSPADSGSASSSEPCPHMSSSSAVVPSQAQSTASPAANTLQPAAALPSGAPNQPGFSVLPMPGAGSASSKRHLAQHKRYEDVLLPRTLVTVVKRPSSTLTSELTGDPTVSHEDSAAQASTAYGTSRGAATASRRLGGRFYIPPSSDTPNPHPRATASSSTRGGCHV